MSNLIISICNDSFSLYLISGMDQDVEDPFDLSDPLDIQENELISSEQNVAIDPMSVCKVEIKN